MITHYPVSLVDLNFVMFLIRENITKQELVERILEYNKELAKYGTQMPESYASNLIKMASSIGFIMWNGYGYEITNTGMVFKRLADDNIKKFFSGDKNYEKTKKA